MYLYIKYISKAAEKSKFEQILAVTIKRKKTSNCAYILRLGDTNQTFCYLYFSVNLRIISSENFKSFP